MGERVSVGAVRAPDSPAGTQPSPQPPQRRTRRPDAWLSCSALRALLRHVLHAPGGKLSVNRLAGQLRATGISVATGALYEFVGFLADAYVVFPVEIHTRSIRKRQVNPRKMYAVDTDLLRAVSLGITADNGALLENLVFLGLRRRGVTPDYYVPGAGNEVDFVYQDDEGRTRFVQVCWSLDDPATRERELHAPREALAECPGATGTVVTWMDEEQSEGVPILPAWRWLLEGAGA